MPGRWNEFIDCPKAKVRIAIQPIMDVITRWNSTIEFLEWIYQLWEFTREWLKNPMYSEYRLLFTTQDDWTIIKYVMEVWTQFRYWTLWMSERHTVTLHHVIHVYNDMFHLMDGIMRALAKKKTQWKEGLYFAAKFVWQKPSKYYSEVTPTTGLLLISAHILDPCLKLGVVRKFDKGMDITPDDESSYTMQSQEAFLKYVENEYYAKHRRLSVNKSERVPSNNPFSTTASGSGQSSFDPYDSSSNDHEYLTPKKVAEMTPGHSDHAARLLTAARLCSNSAPEAPTNWGQFNPNHNDYHSDPIEISSAFWLPNITE